MLLAAAGALLLTPGFITDAIGFVLLTGPLRRQIASSVVRSGMVKAMGGSASGASFGHFSSGGGQRGRQGGPNVYEGDYHEESASLSESEQKSDAVPNKKDQ